MRNWEDEVSIRREQFHISILIIYSYCLGNLPKYLFREIIRVFYINIKGSSVGIDIINFSNL